MRRAISTLSVLSCLTVSGLALTPFSASEARAQTDPSGFCPGGQIVFTEGVQDCILNDTLERLIEDVHTADIAQNPIAAGSEGERDALKRLPDVSFEQARAQRATTQTFLARHAALDIGPLSDTERLNYDLLGFVLGQRDRLNAFDEARIPFTNDSGFFNEISYISRQTLYESPEDFEAYAARLSALPRYFGQHKANMRRGIETGYTASAEILPGIIAIIKTLGETPAQDHPFFKPFTTIPDSFDPEQRARLKALGQAAMDSAVLPAYGDLLTFMETEYAPKARATAGIGTTPEGRAYYEALVKHFTTLDLTPDAVHEIGLEEVARIRAEMDTIIETVEFEGSFAEFLEFLRTDPQFYANSKTQLLKEAAWLAKQIDGRMPEFFTTLPRLSYGIIPVPDEIAPRYTTGRYWNGNPEQGRAGNYVVNTHDLTQRPLYNLPALTAHEGVPGHHHQISLAQELDGVPRFRQSLYPNAFGEGWGLYAEKLGIEMGIYKTPYEHFGRLTYEMWRACRLVVDTGIHWKGWTRERAERCFFENTALAPHNIHTEVERYISWPGQALSYKIGELKILELRQRAEDTLGARFSIRDFHDAVLLEGGLPLTILEQKIDAWIANQSRDP